MKKDQVRNTAFFSLQRIKPQRPLLVIIFLLPGFLFSQPVRVDAEQQALNQVLIRLGDEYGLQMSFDDGLLSQYRVTIHRDFPTAEQAVSALLEPFPLGYQLVDDAFVIMGTEPVRDTLEYRLSGRIIDQYSGETLPFSHIYINNHWVTTDFSGHFSASSSGKPVFELHISHLGYFFLDTLVEAGHGHVIGLVPSVFELGEVHVTGSNVVRSGQVGEGAGELRLNHKVAYRLPGNGDDAVFNFLRLQPGIMAAGEQASEMLIWGGYSGNSLLLFDGFTIFGPRNFNDNISFVNPYMAKDIRVLKGGYPAEYGDRVGGIVEITGIEGSRHEPVFNLNINNMTLSGMASLPVRNRASITAAFRHTYYNIYNSGDLGVLSGREDGNLNSVVDITVYPAYRFRDANLKYSGTTGNGNPYFISLYTGGDLFSYEAVEEKNRLQVNQTSMEKGRQLGGSAYFGKTWEKGYLSNFSISYSALTRELYEHQEIFQKQRNLIISDRETRYNSGISEVVFRNNNYLDLGKRHHILAGVGYVMNNNVFLQDYEEVISSSGYSGRVNFHIQDDFHPLPGLSLKPGIRMDYPLYLHKVYFQPRFQFSMRVSTNWNFKWAWGLYRQFISETSVLDDLGNYRYFWVLCNSETIPVLKAQHLVGGIVYQRKGFTLSIEPFYKTVDGLTRLVTTGNGQQDVFRGRARMYGTDFLLKQYFRKHEAWISYTLSRVEEHFTYFDSEAYAEAPQDQRHEVKAALLLDIQPFYFSMNYVLGSGLAYGDFPDSETGTRYPYSRLDVSLVYRRIMKRFRMDAGISVLNVFNRENIKYSNLFEIPDGQFSSFTIHAEAVPFTPTLFINLAF